MATATLTKWGNSQGITIPKTICDSLGWSVGDKVEINPKEDGTIELKSEVRRFNRTKKLTIEQVFEGWQGQYEPPHDFELIGNEINWGSPEGKEVW